jgi:hypothetical protein
MRLSIRATLAVLSLAWLAASFGPLTIRPAQAQAGAQQGQPLALKQIPLTQKQIDAVLASQKEMDAATSNLPENAPPSPKVVAQLGGIAKKYGFASYDDYNTVMDNISLVMGGIDPQTKKYVGSDAVIKQELDQVKADTKMSAQDKKAALANLEMAMKAKEPEVQNKGNIDLVVKNYDKLSALGEGQN